MDAYIATNIRSTVLEWNAAAEKMFGWSAVEAIGRSLPLLVVPERLRESLRQEWERFAQSGQSLPTGRTTTSSAQDRNGREFSVEITVNALGEGTDTTFHAFVRDITEQQTLLNRALVAETKSRNVLVQLVEALAATAEIRDPYTAGHQRRVAQIASAIAAAIGWDSDSQRSESLFLGCLIHDLGKLHIPSEILNKPGRLSDLEFDMIKQHPETGYRSIEGVEFEDPTIGDIVLHHHERLDGSGYPEGLVEEQISIEVRIAAVADVLEAMTSHRPYRPALPLSTAMEELSRGRAIRYDKDVVDAVTHLLAGTAAPGPTALMPPIAGASSSLE